MITLPNGKTVYIGGRAWTGQIPEHLCPAHLKPVPAPKRTREVTPAEPEPTDG